MELLDIITVNDKVMKIVWISSSHIVTGLPNGDSIKGSVLSSPNKERSSEMELYSSDECLKLLIRLVKAENTITFSKIFITLQVPDSSKGMKWLNAASELIKHHSIGNNSVDDDRILVTGSRDVWLWKSCHRPGGCISILVVKQHSHASLFTCGRTYGEVKHWSVQSNGALYLFGTILRSEHMTWIDKLYRSDGDKIYALGFQSKYFKAISLNHKCLKDDNHLNWSLMCPVRSGGCFLVDCAGGNHYWDWFLPNSIKITKTTANEIETPKNSVRDYQDDSEHMTKCFSPLFASINRGRVLIHSDVQNCISCEQNKCCPTPIYLRVSLNVLIVIESYLVLRSHLSSIDSVRRVDKLSIYIVL
ncbi:unnamed protein product [Trichobilharzia regenti]|nr:unnamed protein product [Trichobilharzia regenti]